MARIALDFADSLFCFETTIEVRITDVNAGKHLGNDTMISLISEARAQFFHHYGHPADSDAAVNVIVTDLATIYRNEAFARDRLRFQIGLDDLNRYGGDVVFRITRVGDEALIALAKTGFVFFDYTQSRVAPMPADFRAQFPQAYGAG